MVSRPRILLVEKDHAERIALASVLASEYLVRDVESGGAALAALEEDPPDLVLIGRIGEGETTGELLPRLRAFADGPKVLLLSPEFCPALVDRARRCRADGVLSGRDTSEIVAAVAAHLCG